MQPNQILCPVDYVKTEFPFPQQNLQPVIEFLHSNTPLPEANTAFPVGTITTDGRLDMCKQQLGIRGLELVAEPLKSNQVVKHLLLGTNAFGNTGAAAVAELVAANKTIETVYLGCNYIEQEGCKAICEAVEVSTSVTSVWFKRNPIGAESMPAIIKMLSVRRSSPAWLPLFLGSFVINWIIPFFTLLARPAKRSIRVMLVMAIVVLAGRWLDLYLMIMPSHWEAPHLGILELAMAAGTAGAIIAIVARGLARAPLVPTHEPVVALSQGGSQ